MASFKFDLDRLRSSLVALKEAGELLPLSIAEVAGVLSAFVVGEISKEEIADWAEFYDGNEDVVLESDDLIPDVLFELSSPEINGWLQEVRARELISMLEQNS